jgi:hypothetical protein
MQLAQFIARDMEHILKEWEAFAGTLLPAARGMTPLALRDHAEAILKAVAIDISTSQSAHAQAEKSKGQAPILIGAPETAAQMHATLRAKGGFDVNQMVAEYRALRASVLRLWIDACRPNASDLDDVIRFNEAIDQAITESVRFFNNQVEQARDLLLGMLGHDMRTPLSSIVATASYLAELNAGREVSQAAGRLIRSGAAMHRLLDDLVNFSRIRLGLGIRLELADIDLAKALHEELEQFRDAHPHRRIGWKVAGDARGRWDGPRLQQLLRNLVSNAIQYGNPDTPIDVSLIGDEDVRIEVRNTGVAIDKSVVELIFDPPTRSVERGLDGKPIHGLGLGLYIVREIARAHGGEVNVRSEDSDTLFVVRLPRRKLE